MCKRNRIDPTKISGPYSLLAVMLLVAEILFAIWFYKAETPTERSIAGLIIATFFVCLMLLVMKMSRTPAEKNAKSPISVQQKTMKKALLFRPFLLSIMSEVMIWTIN